MSKEGLPTHTDNYQTFNGGIAPYNKKAYPNQYAFGRSIDVRTNPSELTLLPKTTKESGSVYQDLPMAADRVGSTTYFYDRSGNMYTRSSAGSHALVRSVSNSQGNGMRYFGEDDFLYYTSNKAIGRYGQLGGTPSFVDDFLGAEGGVPLNTHWIDLESSSSQHAYRADTASLSITGDLSLEAVIRPESLPSTGNSMTIMGKWDENGNIRSYKFDIYAISGYFGDGSDSSLTVSSNTTESPTDSACTGTTGTTSLSATNASFAAGQEILIIQSQGTGAGNLMRNTIVSYSTGTITLEDELNATYGTGAQVRVLPQYTNVTIDASVAYTAKAWNGTVGGILAFLANGTITINGTITASEKGFRGGTGVAAASTKAYQGEGTAGTGSQSTSANGNGGGGADTGDGGGGGGSNGTQGDQGRNHAGSMASAGNTAGSADLTTMVFGGGGGGASNNDSGKTPADGGAGGGIIFLAGVTLTINSGASVISAGEDGEDGDTSDDDYTGAAAGAGGSILLKAQTATLGTELVTALGGSKGNSSNPSVYYSGDGGDGRIHLDYYTSYTGTTDPTLDVVQDNTLEANTTYQLRLNLSSNGTAEETLSKSTDLIATDTTMHVAVTWDASESLATFYINGASIGTATGAVTSLNDNSSRFAIGADFDTNAQNFYDGKMDEVRVFNVIRTASQINNNKENEIAVNTAGLQAYYQLDNAVTDGTSNSNDLTASGSPTYATDVPFSSPTTRLDLDQSLDTSSDTYAITTSISEAAAHRQTFVPAKDPQKSVEVNVSDTGDDGDWTLTVHDVLNRTVATATVTNANMHTGDFEFVFDDVWRPIIGASYHFHITVTSTTGTPAVVATSSNDLETGDFHTYYQFLVEDEYHPIEQQLNFLCIGNERYVATWDASSYNPHRLTLPSGWRVRCMAKWNHYIVFGCWRETDVSDSDKGLIVIWDGYSDTYNEAIEVPQGAVNAMFGSQGTLSMVAGYQGDVLEYTGESEVRKVRRLPKITKDQEMEILPNAMTMWQSLLRIGGATGDSDTFERGVYTLGKIYDEDPEALTYDYPLSTGTRTATTVEVGVMLAVDKQLLVGFRNSVGYGVDVVDPAGSAFTTGTVERDIKDYGAVWKEKKAMLVRADFKPLTSGQTVQLKYKLDRNSEWTYGSIVSTANKAHARLEIPYGNHKEVQVAADLATTISTGPSILELTLEEDLKKSEQMI